MLLEEVQQTWKCPLCATENTTDICSGCGKVSRSTVDSVKVDANTVADNNVQTAADTINTETDLWKCAYCGYSKNVQGTDKCSQCGIAKKSTEQLQKVIEYTPAEIEDAEIRLTEKVKKILKNPIFLLCLIVISLCFGCFVVYKLTFVRGSIVGMGWHKSVQIEQFQEVEESGYVVPENAEIIDSTQVFTHYAITYAENESDLQAVTEVITETGYKAIVGKSKQECTVTQKVLAGYNNVETDTQVQKEAQYRTKYTYRYKKWVPVRCINAGGKNKVVYACKYVLDENERVSKTTEQYYIDVQVKKEKVHVYLDYNKWSELSTQDKYVLQRKMIEESKIKKK